MREISDDPSGKFFLEVSKTFLQEKWILYLHRLDYKGAYTLTFGFF